VQTSADCAQTLRWAGLKNEPIPAGGALSQMKVNSFAPVGTFGRDTVRVVGPQELPLADGRRLSRLLQLKLAALVGAVTGSGKPFRTKREFVQIVHNRRLGAT